MHSQDHEPDALTAIKGIGEVKQRWLQDAGIQSLQDLAARSVDELERALAATGRHVPRGELESWIEQAQALTKISPSPVAVEAVVERETQAVSASEQAIQPSPNNGWKAVARFMVEFQTLAAPGGEGFEPYRTAANHVMRDGDQILKRQIWPGLQSEQLCQWMLEQLGEKSPAATPTDTDASVVNAPVQVEITALQIIQPPDRGSPLELSRPNQPAQALIHRGMPLALVALFVLAGKGAANAPYQDTHYRAQFYLRDQITGTHLHLGDAAPAPLVAGRSMYQARIEVASLQAGLYRLWVVVLLSSKPPAVASLEVPLLHVI
jgi:hypothetical protein